jgi:hypothetical protein
MGLLPITAASVELTFIGFMKAALGFLLAAGFFAFAAGFFVAAFFIGFLAAGFFAAGFFDAFLPFLDAIDESSNLMVTLSSVHLASNRRDSERMRKGKTLVNRFHSGEGVFSLCRIACATSVPQPKRYHAPHSCVHRAHPAKERFAWRPHPGPAIRRRISTP